MCVCLCIHWRKLTWTGSVTFSFFLWLKWGSPALGHGNKGGKTKEGEIGTGNKGQVPWGEVWWESARRQVWKLTLEMIICCIWAMSRPGNEGRYAEALEEGSDYGTVDHLRCRSCPGPRVLHSAMDMGCLMSPAGLEVGTQGQCLMQQHLPLDLLLLHPPPVCVKDTTSLPDI